MDPDDRLDEAMAHASVPTLIPVLVQLTGDERWLEERYRPTRAPGMSLHDSGGLDPAVQQEIRSAAAEAVRAHRAGRPVAVPVPDPALSQRLMDVCMGEPVDPAYERMMAEEMGFRPEVKRPMDPPPGFRVLVVGAGVSGVLSSIVLAEAGVEHVVVEKNDDVGGTWLENRYPGAGGDTPSYLYSYSFAEHDWSTHFGKRDEMIGYLRDVVEEYGVRPRIRFGREVVSLVWDEATMRWTATLDDGDTVVADAVITCVGILNRPKIPEIPGMSAFRGPLFHSAQWPEDLDVTGQRVAVVGSGASAMQIVPAIAGTAAHVTVFQRSPQWIAPNEVYFTPVPGEVHRLMAEVPFYRLWYRFRLNLLFNDKVHPSLQVDPEWPHPERSVNRQNDKHRAFFTAYLQAELDGRPDLQEKALPDYPPFGKRMLLDNGWYAALKRPDVTLVTEAATSFTPTAVVAADGSAYQADVVVLATGFRPLQVLYPMDIRGRDGRVLREEWGQDDASAYLGVTVPGFPNLFLTAGPATALGHGGSYITTAECQVRYIRDALRRMFEAGVDALDVREEAYAAYTREVDRRHEGMVWSHRGMSNWYRNAAGRVVSSTPWRIVDYWAMTHDADLADYHLLRARTHH